MSDIGNYFSQQDEIVALKVEIEALKKSAAIEVLALKKRIRSEIVAKSKYKIKWENLSNKQPIRKSRCEKAREVIAKRHSGEIKITLVEIAETYFLGYSTVKALARDYRKSLV